MDDLSDALTREGLLSEADLDVVEDLSVRRVGLVQNVLEREICRSKPVTKVLCKDPSAVYSPRQPLKFQIPHATGSWHVR